MITILQPTIETILGYVTDTWLSVAPLVMLAIGLPLGFWAMRKVIGLVRAR